MSAPHAAQGRCPHAARRQRSTSSPPSTTKSTNPKCSATTVSASARYPAVESVTGGGRGAGYSPPRQREPAELRVGESLDASANQPAALPDGFVGIAEGGSPSAQYVVSRSSLPAQLAQGSVCINNPVPRCPPREIDGFVRPPLRHSACSLHRLDAGFEREQGGVIRSVQGRPQQRLPVDLRDLDAADVRCLQPPLRIERHQPWRLRCIHYARRRTAERGLRRGAGRPPPPARCSGNRATPRGSARR